MNGCVSNLHSPHMSVCTPRGLRGVRVSPCALRMDCAESKPVCADSAYFATLHKNCTTEESNHSGTNSSCWTRALPLCHCGLLYSDNLCYMCNLWPHWEICLLLFNMGHMIYVLDQFFSVNSMVMSVL